MVYFRLLTLPVAVVLVFVSPVLLDPLFNSFSRSSRRSRSSWSRSRAPRRAAARGPRERLFEMKASEKVTTYNAYVTGLGATSGSSSGTTRRATSASRGPSSLPAQEWCGHVYQELAFVSAILLGSFWLGGKLVARMLARWGERWGVRGLDDWASLPVLILALSLVLFAATPVLSAFSRHCEHQADVFALEVTHGLFPESAQVAATTFQKLGEKGLAYPTPNPLLVFWTYSHPPIADRVAFVLGYDPWNASPGPVYVK